MKFSTIRFLLLSGFVLLCSRGAATAQNADGQANDARFGPSTSQSDYYVDYRGGGGGGGYGDWGGGHASTAQEGMARGMADVIRSRGQASVDYARAATESERARRSYLENRNFAVSSFVENRAIRDAYRATADNSFYKNKDKLAAYLKTRELPPLSKSDFYESTGEVNWPVGLTHPHDEKGRKQIEDLFVKRAQEGSLASADYVRLTQLIRDWRMHIGSHESFSNNENREAARFLLRLEKYLRGDFQ